MKMKRRNWLKLVVTILAIIVIVVLMYLRWRRIAGWGTGNLKTAERYYYTNHINDIIENWLQARKDPDNYYEDGGRMKQSYTTLLVIDTAENAIWLEENGKIRQDNHIKLPSSMTWTLYRSTPQGSAELPGRTHLKIRGYYSEYQDPEQLRLIGKGGGVGQIEFAFTPINKRTSYSSRPLALGPYNAGFKKTEKSYLALVMTDAEYRRHSASLSPEDPNRRIAQSPLDRNKASWRKVEKLFYQQFEKRVNGAGYKLRGMRIAPGPDFSAAYADVGMRSDGFVHEFLRGRFCGGVYLKIDHLGDDIWYAATTAYLPRSGAPRPPRLDLEFLVCPTAGIPRSQRKKLIRKAREIQDPAVSSKYIAVLANGATVEFIGICENPSLGKQWWRPDGTPLDHTLYVTDEVLYCPRDNTQIYEMAWRLKWSRPSAGRIIQTSCEGHLGSYFVQLSDRYGTTERFRTTAYALEKSRKKTNLKISAKLPDGYYHHVEFKNISLVPSKDTGFEIELVN